MKIVVIGGTGLIGSKLVTKLSTLGHEAVAAAPNTGVNTLTGEGLAEVLKGAHVVVDVSNSPSFEDTAVLDFFQTSTRNLLSYEAAAGVGHHIALSVVGSERLPQSGYMRAKVAQEKLIKEGTIPYTIWQAYRDFAVPFYGANKPGAKVSQGILAKSVSEKTDFTADLKKFDVPTLVLHGEDDQIVPVKYSARKSAQLIKDAKDIYYPGAPHGITATHQDQINADLLAFIAGQQSAAA